MQNNIKNTAYGELRGKGRVKLPDTLVDEVTLQLAVSGMNRDSAVFYLMSEVSVKRMHGLHSDGRTEEAVMGVVTPSERPLCALFQKCYLNIPKTEQLEHPRK